MCQHQIIYVAVCAFRFPHLWVLWITGLSNVFSLDGKKLRHENYYYQTLFSVKTLEKFVNLKFKIFKDILRLFRCQLTTGYTDISFPPPNCEGINYYGLVNIKAKLCLLYQFLKLLGFQCHLLLVPLPHFIIYVLFWKDTLKNRL